MQIRAGFGRIALAAGAAILVLLPAALPAQSDDRRRALGDWLVEDVDDEFAGRSVRLTREAGDYLLDYHMSVRPGASRVEVHGFMIVRLNCGQGGDESIDGPAEPEAAE